MIFSGIAAAIGAIGTFIGGLGAIGAAALQVTVGIGLSYLSQAIAGKPNEGAPAATQSAFAVQGTLQHGGDVPRSFPLGATLTAGSLVYANTWGNSGGTPNAFETQVRALSDLPIPGISQVWVDGKLCTLDSTAHATLGYPVLEYRVDGVDHVWIKFYDGTQTTADSLLVNSVSSVDRPYASTRVGYGIAYVICTSRVNNTLFTGHPDYKFTVQGIPLYDPSKDDTAGGTGDHRYSDPSTWGGDGDNFPAVQIYNVKRGIKYGGNWLYGLQNMTANRLPTSNWIAQIEKCRDEIDGLDGLEPTYRSGLQVNVNTQIAETVKALLTACQGKVSEIGGFYKIHLGEPDSPVFSFTDDDIISTEEQSFTPFYGLSDTINGISAKYPEPAEGWNTKVAPPLYNSDYEVQDGNRRLMADVSLDAVPYSAQVQRLMASALAEARRARRHTQTHGPEAWIVEPGDVVSWTSIRNSYSNKLLRVDGMVDKANLDVTLDLTEVDPTDFNPPAEYIEPVTGPTGPVYPPTQQIVDWDADPYTIIDDDGLSRRPAILLQWNGDVDDVAAIQYEVRLKLNNSVVNRGSTNSVTDGETVISENLLPNTIYEVRGRYVPANPRDTEWSDWLTVTTPDVRFSTKDWEEGLADYVENQLGNGIENLNFNDQRIAAVAAEQEAENFLDTRSTRDILSVQRDDFSAQITETAQIAESISGKLQAAWFVTVDVNGYTSGIANYNDGTQADFIIVADNFMVAQPGAVAPKPVFEIGTVDGVTTLVLAGDLYADGTIRASALVAANLSVISADLGTVTAGRMQSADGKVIFDLDGKFLEFWD